MYKKSARYLSAVAVAILAAIGGYASMGDSSAASYVVSGEAEAGQTAGPAGTVSDTTASGDQAVAFTAAQSGGFKANCIVKPSVCGYPDETNTGVPPGTTLTNSGDITVTQNGAIVEAKNITGSITVNANNVTIRKSRITSGDYYPIRYDDEYTGLVVEDTEIIGTTSSVTAGISFEDYTARRVHVRGAADGLKANSNVMIEDSYIHDLRVTNDSHNDGIQSTGGANVTIRHNTCKLSTTNGANTCLQMGNEWAINSGWLITNNLLDGGGWIINAGNKDINMTYTNNRFTRNSGYGPGVVSGSGVLWSGNYYDNNNGPVE